MRPPLDRIDPSTNNGSAPPRALLAQSLGEVIGVSAGLALAALPGVSLAVALAAGAVVGASALWMHCSQQRRAGNAYELEGIDRYATLAAEAQATRRATPGS